MSQTSSKPSDSRRESTDNDRIRRPEWLVSVRNLPEFLEVASFDVDYIDLKEPTAGALAATSIQTWREIAQSSINRANRGIKLSAALGESDQAAELASELPKEFGFAKAGPSGLDSAQKLTELWSMLRQQLCTSTQLVAVAYADATLAECVEPEQVLESAVAAGLNRFLIDTYVKDGKSTIEKLGLERLATLSQRCRSAGVWWALAGQIKLTDLPKLASAAVTPNCLAVRGDACDSDRKGTISVARMTQWQSTLTKCQTTKAS